MGYETIMHKYSSTVNTACLELVDYSSRDGTAGQSVSTRLVASSEFAKLVCKLVLSKDEDRD